MSAPGGSSSPTSIGVVCAAGSRTSRSEPKLNHDNYLVCRDGKMTWRDGTAEKVVHQTGIGTLLAVADGMGGAHSGNIASSVAVRVLSKLYGTKDVSAPDRVLRRYLIDAHQNLWGQTQTSPNAMGSTLSTCWFIGPRAGWANVGDSRIYLYRDQALRQLTSDQTHNEFAHRDHRPYPPSGGDELAQSFIYGSRGLGNDSVIRLDPGLDCGTVNLKSGDRIVLCTDGLWSAVDQPSIASVLHHVPDPQAAAVSLMERAVARGGEDHITIIVVRIGRLTPRSTLTP